MKLAIEQVQPIYNAERVQVLRAWRLSPAETLVLYRSSELKYFKNGRANMHMQITYNVEVLIGETELQGTRGIGYRFTNKSEALKAFNNAK